MCASTVGRAGTVSVRDLYFALSARALYSAQSHSSRELCSYGSTLRYKSVERMKPIGKHSLLGASGEISDFQELLKYLDELVLYDNMWDDGNSLGPKEIHNYLTRVMYNRRNKFNPLWNSLVLGGVKNGKQYLGMVSMIGVNFEDDHVATGFGNHLARPILRDEWRADLSFEEGVKLLEKCMRVLLYRDRSAVNKLQIAKITEEGVTISKPYALKTFWGYSAFQNPTAGAEGSCFKYPETKFNLMESNQANPSVLCNQEGSQRTLYGFSLTHRFFHGFMFFRYLGFGNSVLWPKR
ncbi:hypothetical protein ACLB2K_013766 [Fragaria x ananassa]